VELREVPEGVVPGPGIPPYGTVPNLTGAPRRRREGVVATLNKYLGKKSKALDLVYRPIP